MRFIVLKFGNVGALGHPPRRSYKSVLLFILLIGLVITSCDFSNIKAPSSDKRGINTLKGEKNLVQNKSKKTNSVYSKNKVSDRIIIVKKSYEFTSIKNGCNINITYPYVRLPKKTKLADTINRTILKGFKLSNDKKMQNEKECADEDISKNFDFVIYNEILSISIFNNFLGHGAGHGYKQTIALNISLVTGKRILTEELFNPNVLNKLKEKLLSQAKLKTDSLIGNVPMDLIIQGVNQLNYTISDKGFTFYTLTGNGQVQEISIFVPLTEIIYYLKPNSIFIKTKN